jgi:hypothetical protein
MVSRLLTGLGRTHATGCRWARTIEGLIILQEKREVLRLLEEVVF